MSRGLYRLLALLVVCGAILLFPGRAAAHAHLLRADLTPDGHLVVRAGVYRFWFDEPLNWALSRIVIRDGQGRQVNAGTGRLNPANAEEMDLTLPTLAPGQYSVVWTSDSSQDGHVLHGFYLFTIGGAGAAAPSAVPTATITSVSPALDSAALAMALTHWLVLLSTVLWTGLLALEILVLSPALSEPARPAPELTLLASGRGRHMARVSVLGALLASLAELEAQAYASGGWAGMGSTTVLDDILRSHYGMFWLIRMVLALLTYLALWDGGTGLLVHVARRGNTAPRRLASRQSVAGLPGRGGGAASWLSARAAAGLGLASLLALALSGHAASVPQLLVTSVLLDWLHLVATAVWIGGMAALALALLPALSLSITATGTTRSREGRLAFLVLLDRFTPAAYLAVATAAVTGMFNAQVHLGSLDQLTGTTYGRFLLIKLALIVEIMLMSASHVFITRPRLRALPADEDPAVVERGYVSLAARLRVEPLLGALVLLCVALMGQVAPSVLVFAQPPVTVPAVPPASTAGAIPFLQPSPISATISRGLLSVTLTIDSPTVGHTRFGIRVRERGTAVSNAQVRIRLFVPGMPSLGAVFVETTPAAGGYTGYGDLVRTDRWQADVLVRTHGDPLEYRDVSFAFLVGPDASFLGQGNPAAITISAAPGRVDLPTTFTLGGIHASAVRLLSRSLDMDMGNLFFPAVSLGGGRWRVGNQFAPMNGRWGITIQERQNGSWLTLRQVVYFVPASGSMHLLSASTRPDAPLPTATIDPRLILRSRTLTQLATIQGLHLRLVANPLFPGPNHLELTLSNHGRVVRGARVSMAARMTDMTIPPLRFAVHETQAGRYEASGSLTMFGTWQLTVGVDRPDGLHLSHIFVLGLDLPPGLLGAFPGATASSTPTAGGG